MGSWSGKMNTAIIIFIQGRSKSDVAAITIPIFRKTTKKDESIAMEFFKNDKGRTSLWYFMLNIGFEA